MKRLKIHMKRVSTLVGAFSHDFCQENFLCEFHKFSALVSGATLSSSTNGINTDSSQRRVPPMPSNSDISNLSPLTIDVGPVLEGLELMVVGQHNNQTSADMTSQQCTYA